LTETCLNTKNTILEISSDENIVDLQPSVKKLSGKKGYRLYVWWLWPNRYRI